MKASNVQVSPPVILPVSRLTILLAGGLFVAVVLAAYHNGFSIPFVFDDLPAVRDNPGIRNLSDAVAPSQGSGLPVDGRPVVNVTLALNYAMSGLQVGSYHAVNVAIHVLAGLVLFGIVRRTLLQPGLRARYAAVALPLALIGAMLWAVHPLQTESVDYVVQRAESLMGLFYLLTLYGFIRWAEPGAARFWPVLAVGACLLGMASKEVMVSAPLMVLLYDRAFVSGTFQAAWRRHRGLYGCLALTWLPLGWLVLGSAGRGGTAGFAAGVTWWQYGLTQCTAIAHYLGLALWPGSLVFDYGTELVTAPGRVLPAMILVAVLIGGTLWALWRRPQLGFAGAWFLLILAPTSSILPVATQTMAEHRMYLSLAAVLVPALLLVYHFLGRRTLFVGAALVLALAWLSVLRNRDYRSSLALWQDTTVKRPHNPRAHCNLGDALFLSGNTSEAISQYGEALHLRPSYPEAEYNLGNALIAAGRRDEAISHYEAALQSQPGMIKIQLSLANALAQMGRMAEATPHYEAALRIDSKSAQAHGDWGTALVAAGDISGAIEHYETALRLKPNFGQVHNNLGNVLAQRGQLTEAAGHYDDALRIKPDDAEAQNNLGNVLAQQGRTPEAVQHYEAALRIDPNYAEAHNNLGMAFAQLDDLRGAREHFETALRIRPNYPQARENLSHLDPVGRER